MVLNFDGDRKCDKLENLYITNNYETYMILIVIVL